MKRISIIQFTSTLLLFAVACCLTATGQSVNSKPVEQWGVYELSMNGPASGNPYIENSLGATFTNGAQKVRVPGFYDGDGQYKIRFSPGVQGEWSYVTQSNQPTLNNQTGGFQVHCTSREQPWACAGCQYILCTICRRITVLFCGHHRLPVDQR